jgi:CheY-like chemotaxis protein
MSSASDSGGTKRPGTAPALRANAIVEPDGRELLELSVYCPACAVWQAVDPRDESAQVLAAHASRSNVPGDDAWGRTPISEIMTRRVVCVRDRMPIAQLAALFLARNLGGAPVVDAGGDLVGVVTRGDLLRFGWEESGDQLVDAIDSEPDGDGWTPDDRLADIPFDDACRVVAAQIMTPFAFALPSHAPVAQAAALMAYEGVHRIVVVSPDGAIVGLIAGLDVMRWIAHQAGYVIPDRQDRRSEDVQIVAPVGGSDPAVVPAHERRARRKTDPGVRPRLVMIIDDDAAVREDYAELLREEGYQVLTAANGREALDQLAAVRTPSLFLLDLKMPVMDGWKFHTQIADHPLLGKVPVVLLSGSSDVFEEASRMSADDFLLKPVPVRELLGTVEQYCS